MLSTPIRRCVVTRRWFPTGKTLLKLQTNVLILLRRLFNPPRCNACSTNSEYLLKPRHSKRAPAGWTPAPKIHRSQVRSSHLRVMQQGVCVYDGAKQAGICSSVHPRPPFPAYRPPAKGSGPSGIRTPSRPLGQRGAVQGCNYSAPHSRRIERSQDNRDNTLP